MSFCAVVSENSPKMDRQRSEKAYGQPWNTLSLGLIQQEVKLSEIRAIW